MTKKDKERVDKDTRPEGPWYQNYDYLADPKEDGPGPGLYQGKMDKYKSVKDFVEKSRERRRKKRKEALDYAISILKKYDKKNN